MRIKKLLRKMRWLRYLYYTIQFKNERKRLPSDLRLRNFSTLEKLKDAYKGERCFIIGNGPSLTIEDLEKLKDEYTFASNRICSLYEKTNWRPTFYAIQDELVVESIKMQLGEIVQQSKIGFVSMKHYIRCEKQCKEADNLVWFPLRFIPPKNKSYYFSDNATKQIIEGLTITYSCIQLAVHMGFKQIYLLGVDHNYAVEIDDDGNIIKEDLSVKEYFDEAKISLQDKNLPKVVEMTRAYISAEKKSKEGDFRVYNATRGGKLEIFKRVNFDELFNETKELPE